MAPTKWTRPSVSTSIIRSHSEVVYNPVETVWSPACRKPLQYPSVNRIPLHIRSCCRIACVKRWSVSLILSTQLCLVSRQKDHFSAFRQNCLSVFFLRLLCHRFCFIWTLVLNQYDVCNDIVLMWCYHLNHICLNSNKIKIDYNYFLVLNLDKIFQNEILIFQW